MQAYTVTSGKDIAGLTLVTRQPRELGPLELRVRIKAVSLNYRDLMVARGEYLKGSGDPVIPASDAAGEVIEVGSGVTRYKIGDRVMGAFMPDWIDGEPTPATVALAPGAATDGMLATESIFSEHALVAIPDFLSDEQASTLPCAAVTAWNALFVAGRAKAGQTALFLGTGGVSIWGLQLAKAAGMRTIITSSSADKLARARELGADLTINYRETPEWQDEVRRLTGGEGAQVVVEVGGEGTLERSVAAARMGGTIAVIGGVSGFASVPVAPLALISGVKRLEGIFVGSRKMLEDVARFVDVARIAPVIDRVYSFDQAREAFEHLASGKHFGKLVIRVAE
ncbi:Alcohol dehydrogenase [Achromobacter anxifer]|jgi:NADPH:quinone reductase-like Zn-dependent oxidoreductase|uniref:zinc-dependent alcohol dehydrogenase family protein n=1 Tax=Achromobacter anxifer TaxID=1287737 RepID=UPI00155BF75B|nr:NAD(P)-dependent alcohol dehydrogenase [Achromobacter anxifer]CAB5512086.1 Alcohol dehydrogenase [Achromobacter anxifer]